MHNHKQAARLMLLLLGLFVANLQAQCINDCSGHGDCNAGQCNCEEGWSGEDCSHYECAHHVDGCSGHGQCRESGCVCHDGFGDYNCAKQTTNCPDFCKGHGSCLDGVCTCDVGYTGDDCGTVDPSVSCPNHCSGHGFCDVSGSTPTCYCVPSYWSGAACDIQTSRCPAELDFCTGHGICGPVDPLQENAEWVCECEPGFCGTKCNEVCPQCTNNCTGHGLCVGTTCNCFTGFGGNDCSLVVPVESCPNNCSGHGFCREVNSQFQCVCESEYGGDSCVLLSELCPGNCGGRGECLVDGSCACNPGFTGSACQTVVANCHAHNNCSANGECVEGVCHCSPGFGGDDCSKACHTGGVGEVGCGADRGHGTCVDGECVCVDGEWEGVGCETPVHDSTLAKVVSTSNPIGIIVISVVGACALLMLGGFAFNHAIRGKRGLSAVPGAESLRSKIKGDDFEAVPENRYTSNY